MAVAFIVGGKKCCRFWQHFHIVTISGNGKCRRDLQSLFQVVEAMFKENAELSAFRLQSEKISNGIWAVAKNQW